MELFAACLSNERIDDDLFRSQVETARSLSQAKILIADPWPGSSSSVSDSVPDIEPRVQHTCKDRYADSPGSNALAKVEAMKNAAVEREDYLEADSLNRELKIAKCNLQTAARISRLEAMNQATSEREEYLEALRLKGEIAKAKGIIEDSKLIRSTDAAQHQEFRPAHGAAREFRPAHGVRSLEKVGVIDYKGADSESIFKMLEGDDGSTVKHMEDHTGASVRVQRNGNMMSFVIRGDDEEMIARAVQMCEDLTATVLGDAGQSNGSGRMRTVDGCKVFVGKLSKSVTDNQLADAFMHIGRIEFARVDVDQATGQPRGFGFVKFITEEARERAIKEMIGVKISGRAIAATHAKPNISKPEGAVVTWGDSTCVSDSAAGQKPVDEVERSSAADASHDAWGTPPGIKVPRKLEPALG